MRTPVLFLSAFLLATPALAQEGGPAGDACADLVGTYLLTDRAGDGAINSRTLFRLSRDGAATFVDSGQWGTDYYAPFSDALGSWVCLSEAGEATSFRAVVIDFTAPAEGGQTIGRVDMEGTLDASGMMIVSALLSFFPLADDPLAGPAEDADPFAITGERIAVPE